ncbi:uncharacterized protein LOC124141863 isoform X4 [Haliotis rufescens]|nr:uncharacterized protein LOC124141863 isoform X4 [Haliotis rufescens]XP_046365982.2 uncharacterized protein LOC124141863 isoform X4 [Haliotis rufescens]XP_046365983.2 uncharacterized protein LOC124141863 isoform X4 [Haliotis rufescens]
MYCCPSSSVDKMAAHIVYHSLHCREMTVDQRTGELKYETASPDLPVAQFIGPKPLTPASNRFSIEIANPGMHCYIAIGVCNRHYPAHRQPGWEANSVGYHADDGGIYVATGFPRHTFGRVSVGEVMACSLNMSKNTVTFYRNERAIYTSPPLAAPPGGFYPVVGLHSHGEMVTLLEVEPWTPDVKTPLRSDDVTYHSLFCREAKVSHSSGTVSYDSMSPDIPVGQFVSECPLSPTCNKFSFEIVNQGQMCYISIGVCHRRYPGNRQPGWLPNSIAYHADDGGIYHGNGQPSRHASRARVGDTMSCEVDFQAKIVIFSLNDVVVYRSPALRLPPGGFHAAIGFHSHGESVCLLEMEPWRSATNQYLQVSRIQVEELRAVQEQYHYSVCRDATLNQHNGVLSFSYTGDGDDDDVPVALLLSKRPMTPDVNTFSIEILNEGRECYIAVGLCPQHYPPERLPGWERHSIGYHADDGGVFVASGLPVEVVPAARQGATMTCQFNFSTNTATFLLNGEKVYQSQPLTVPPGGFYAAVGLNSQGEIIRLCETEPWRGSEALPCLEPGVTPDAQSMPECTVCVDRAVTHFLIPCGHTFCSECMDEWAAVRKTCPTCRTPYQEMKPLYFG